MSKAATIKAVLEKGTFSVGEISQQTGIPANVISVYLSQYSEAWGIQKTGVRRAYRYGIGAASGSQEASAEAAVACESGSV